MKHGNLDSPNAEEEEPLQWQPRGDRGGFLKFAADCRGRTLRQVRAFRRIVDFQFHGTRSTWHVLGAVDGTALSVTRAMPDERQWQHTQEVGAGWRQWAHVLGRPIMNMHLIAMPASQRVLGIHFDCGYGAQAWLLCTPAGITTLPELPFDFVRELRASLMTLDAPPPTARQRRPG